MSQALSSRRMWRVTALAAGFVLGAAAQPSAAADLTDPVAGHPGLTYLDLMKLAAPDLVRDENGASGHHIVPFRHIAGKDAKTDVGDMIQIIDVDPITIAGQGDRLILLADAGSSDESVAEIEFLALFALSPKPRLIDMVEVGTDRFVAVQSTTPPLLAAGSPLIVIESDHSNSNEDYNSSQMIFVRNDRFQPIDDLFTFSESFCAFRREQHSAFSVVPDQGPYKAIRASVRQTVKLTHEDGCNDQPPPRHGGTTTYSATYRWNAARQDFVADSRALDALQKANLKRVESP